jgi:FkbM family methyltransferase
MRSWIREAKFAASRTGSARDGWRLLAHTAHFHLANRGFARDRVTKLPIKIMVGNDWRPLVLRTGSIGDLYILYEVMASDAYHISRDLVAPDTVKTIIDCGANIGLTSLYLASAYPLARVYSVEADPDNFTLLRENTSSETRIIPIHACVVATQQANAHFDNKGPAWGRKSGTIGNGISVPAVTVDQLLSRYAIDRVDLLKMDIEGAEREVLAAGSYLDAVQHVVAELHNDYSFADFGRDVATHGLIARRPDDTGGPVTAHRGHGALLS